MKLEPVRGDLLPKQDRNKHHCQGHLLPELPYHSTCVNGSTSNQESTTDTLFEVSKKMIASTWDRSILREGGAVEFKILPPMFVSQLESSPHRSIRTWLSSLQRGGAPKKRFSDFAEHIYQLLRHALHHPIRIDSGWKRYQEWETDGILHSSESYAYTSTQAAGLRSDEAQNCSAQTKLDIHQNQVYWANLRVAQKKGLTFYQARSDAIILHNTPPAACIEMVVAMSSGVLYNEMYESPRSPGKVLLISAWHEGRTDTASIEESIQRPFQQVRRDLSRWNRPPDSRTTVLYSWTRRPYTQSSSQKVDSSIRNAPKSRRVESRPEAKSRVQPFQRKVEHGERGVLRNVWDLLKNSVPSVFDILDDRILYCTCGTCLYHMEKMRKMNRDRFETLSIPQHVMKKGGTHGARHGNTERQRIYHAAHIAKRHIKRIWLYKGTMSKLFNLQRVTVRDWMGRSIRRTQRRNFKRRSYVRVHRRRA